MPKFAPEDIVAKVDSRGGAEVQVYKGPGYSEVSEYGLGWYCTGCTKDSGKGHRDTIMTKAQEHANGCWFKPQ